MEYQSLIQLMTSSNKTLLAYKKVITPLFLVSVSLFPLVFSDSCSWCHSFSSLPMQLLSHALDKTWIFLICNGIVVVIANTSSITTVEYNNSPSPPPLDANAGNYNDVGSVLELLPEPGNAVSELLEEKENDVGKGNGEPEKVIYCITGDDIGELESEETCSMRMEEEEEDQDQGQVYGHDHEYEYEYEYEYEEEEGGGGEEGMDKLSTEELNKKFEDFIRKMKEELRIQLVQQQQLILSY